MRNTKKKVVGATPTKYLLIRSVPIHIPIRFQLLLVHADHGRKLVLLLALRLRLGGLCHLLIYFDHWVIGVL